MSENGHQAALPNSHNPSRACDLVKTTNISTTDSDSPIRSSLTINVRGLRLAAPVQDRRGEPVRKEIGVTAAVFFVMGFLAGYIYNGQKKASPQVELGTAGGAAGGERPTTSALPAQAGSTAANAGLPEGHPTIDSAVIIQTLEDEASRNPKDPSPRLKLANIFYDQKQYNRAIESYQRALELDPTNVNARTDLGTAYFYSGRPKDALQEYQKSLEIDPRHEPTLFNMIVVHLEGTHDLAAAEKALSRLQKLNPSYPQLDAMRQRLQAARASEGGSRQ